MNKLLLLPSACLVPPELQTEFGAIPSAMVPLNNRPVLHYIAEPYVVQGFELVVAAHQQIEHINRYLRRCDELRARVIDVGETHSLGQTILAVLHHLESFPDQLVINFADTFVSDSLQGTNVVCYREQDDVYRWTTFKLNDDDKLCNLLEKGQDKPFGKALPVFVGVFSISNVADFVDHLSEEVRAPKQHLDPFYRAIQSYFNGLATEQKIFQVVVKWWDFGHIDNYTDTRKSFFLNTRAFNDVRVDSQRGIIRKSSSNVHKFVHEICWYLKLPKKLKYISPQIFDYSLDLDNPYVEMEFYGYPALNDVYLFGDCNIGVWNQIFNSIFHVRADMGNYLISPGTAVLTAAMQEMYETKTLERLAPILIDPRFAFFSGDEIEINGKRCLGLRAALTSLPTIANHLGLYNQDYFSIIHGDLCLSNILYDPKSRIVRLIDPRGIFGQFDVYGDPRYDIAKLCHSIEGDYDFLLNGLFDLSWVNEKLLLRAHTDDRHHAIKALFRNRLMKDWHHEYPRIKLIESLLFLSMVPLHSDRPRSQQAFLGRGLEILSSVAREDWKQLIGAVK